MGCEALLNLLRAAPKNCARADADLCLSHQRINLFHRGRNVLQVADYGVVGIIRHDSYSGRLQNAQRQKLEIKL
jgi:hypothetical protein